MNKVQTRLENIYFSSVTTQTESQSPSTCSSRLSHQLLLEEMIPCISLWSRINLKNSMDCNTFRGSWSYPYQGSQSQKRQNFVSGPSPWPKITGPCDWNGTTQQNNSFSPAISAYSTSNDTPALERAHLSGNFQLKQRVIPTFSAVAGACTNFLSQIYQSS